MHIIQIRMDINVFVRNVLCARIIGQTLMPELDLMASLFFDVSCAQIIGEILISLSK